MVEWTWDPEKNQRNLRDHKIDFPTAVQVFNDPLAATRADPYPDEERFQTIGLIRRTTVFVVHTWPVTDPSTGREIGRIISARKATPHERKAYEDGDF